MRFAFILAGAAALALTTPLAAKPGNGNGGGGGNKGGGAAKVERNGGGGGQVRVDRGLQRTERQEARGQDRRIERRQARSQERRTDRREARGQERFEGRGTKQEFRQAERRQRNTARVADRADGRDTRLDRAAFRRVDVDRRADLFAAPAFRSTGLLDGCPPGLAAKNNGCVPPGQAKKLIGAAIPATLGTALLPPIYRGWYPDNDDYYYRTDDDYVYRIDRDRNLVDGFFPLPAGYVGAYTVGAAYPEYYRDYDNVPGPYQPWYTDNDEDLFRYADGSIYQVDRQSGLIEGIVSLLAGGLGVGQPLPAGYDTYNLPYDYRDRYVDSDEALYRYNDGAIYRVDPTTRLVQAIVETLV